MKNVKPKPQASNVKNKVTTTSEKKVETKSKDNLTKKEKSPKSASQLSISHFSSVSTPEYRAGWERIWGSKKTETIVKKQSIENKSFPQEIMLPNEKISYNTKSMILSDLKTYSKDNKVKLPKSIDPNLKGISINCIISFNKN